jgi:hypothetical protein
MAAAKVVSSYKASVLLRGGGLAQLTVLLWRRLPSGQSYIFRRNQRPDEILSSFDFDLAFLQSDAFAPTEREKHVSFCPHPGYPEEIFKLTGPLYGSDDAPMRFFNTVAPWLISIGFTQAKNDPCLFTNLETGVQLGLHVDD